jgi:hypothetical protein
MPELMKTMREMSMEMEKAGLIEEMMDDAMESLDVSMHLEQQLATICECQWQPGSYTLGVCLSTCAFRERRWRMK